MTYQRTRGNSADRRARKLWLLSEFGDGAVCLCCRCEVPMMYDDLTVDRIIPGARGGTYARCNIRPMCSPCATETGNELKRELRRERLTRAQECL